MARAQEIAFALAVSACRASQPAPEPDDPPAPPVAAPVAVAARVAAPVEQTFTERVQRALPLPDVDTHDATSLGLRVKAYFVGIVGEDLGGHAQDQTLALVLMSPTGAMRLDLLRYTEYREPLLPRAFVLSPSGCVPARCEIGEHELVVTYEGDAIVVWQSEKRFQRRQWKIAFAHGAIVEFPPVPDIPWPATATPAVDAGPPRTGPKIVKPMDVVQPEKRVERMQELPEELGEEEEDVEGDNGGEFVVVESAPPPPPPPPPPRRR